MRFASQRAYAALFGMVQRQASIVSFVTLFQLLGIVFLLKKNYYPFIAFFYLCLAVKIFFTTGSLSRG